MLSVKEKKRIERELHSRKSRWRRSCRVGRERKNKKREKEPRPRMIHDSLHLSEIIISGLISLPPRLSHKRISARWAKRLISSSSSPGKGLVFYKRLVIAALINRHRYPEETMSTDEKKFPSCAS